MIKRRTKNIILSILVLSQIFFLSCGEESGNRNELLYWSSNNPYEIQFARYVVNQWNKKNPDKTPIRFQPVPEGRSSEEIILAAVVGNTTPGIYSNIWQGDVEAYAEAGVLVPFDTLKGFMDFIYERCDSSVVEEIRSQDGHIYQIPWKINPIMLIYNKNIIADLGLKHPPKTYDEFFNACSLFSKDTNGDGYVDQWFGYSEVLVTWWQRFFDFYPLYLAASGGKSLIKNNKAAFNNKYAVEVFSFLQKLYKNNYFAKERLSARQDPFLASVIATRFTGPYEIAHAEKFKPKGFRYGYSTMPVPDDHKGPVYTYCDPKNIVIFKSCKNPQLAWEFIKFMISKKNDLKLLEITTQLPRRKQLDKDTMFVDYFNTNPKMKVFATQSNYVKGTDSSPVLKEVFDIISQEYEACVIYGTKKPEQAINDAANAVNLLFLK
jgi:multiple sugar transport system substrate-binding protein